MVSALSKHSTFVSFSDAVWRIDSGKLDAPFLAFSFDDGMRNNLRAAAVLEEFGTRGMFYVCPSIVGEKDLHKIEIFCRNRLHGPLVDFLDWADLESLVSRGHEIGSHTMSHHRLCQLDQDALRDELSTSRLVLADRLDQGAHFAWPYGSIRDIPKNLGELAKTTGYRTCASAIRGCHVARSETTPDVLCIRRENVQATWPIEHLLTFLCRSSGSANSESNIWPSL
jgi:peptidoglycan/xylan/chitin deacetylase (PgdA/CDA1 family)